MGHLEKLVCSDFFEIAKKRCRNAGTAFIASRYFCAALRSS